MDKKKMKKKKKKGKEKERETMARSPNVCRDGAKRLLTTVTQIQQRCHRYLRRYKVQL